MKMFWLAFAIILFNGILWAMNQPNSQGVSIASVWGGGLQASNLTSTISNNMQGNASSVHPETGVGSSLFIFGDVIGSIIQFINTFILIPNYLPALLGSWGVDSNLCIVIAAIGWLIYVAGLIEVLGGRKVT